MGKDLKGKELGHGIIQKKDGRYEARFVDRFGKRVSISGKDLKDVKNRFHDAVYENEKEINIREDIKLKDWFVKWLEVYKYGTIRDSTRQNYKRMYRLHIAPVLGNFYLKDITHLQIRALIKDLDKKGYSYEVKNKVRIILLDMFNKAMIDDFVRKNPAKGLYLKRNEKKDVRVLTVEEQATFFECCKGTFYDNFYTVAVSTGLRIGELAALEPEDIDFENKVIKIRKTLLFQELEDNVKKGFRFGPPKTDTSVRDVPMTKQCEAALKRQILQKAVVAAKSPYKVDEEFENLIFVSQHNTPLYPQVIIDAIKRIVREINLTRDVTDEIEPFTCHCFRHTFATRCFEAGIQPKTVQEYLGHATLQMTMDLYTKVMKDFKAMEIDKLESMLDEVESFNDNYVEEKYNVIVGNEEDSIKKIGDYVVA